MATDNELNDLGGALALVVGRLVEPVEGMHRIISQRVFRYLGPLGSSLRSPYHVSVSGVYEAIRKTAHVVGNGAGAVVSARTEAHAPISESPTASRVQAAVNALWGDGLEAEGNALAVALSVRDPAAREIPVSRESLAAAHPDATPHMVVLLHGLGQTEHRWQSSPLDGGPSVYESIADAGLSPVMVRYNTGLPVARAGEEVAALLESLYRCWPVADPHVSFVGFSMGGLVARSAMSAGFAAGHGWPVHVRHVVSVGTPHHGSTVEQGVSLASWALRLPRTSRPLARFLDGRSAGIKDLGDGAGIARAWAEAGAPFPAGGGSLAPQHHFVAAVITGHIAHPLGALVGDLIVRVASATGPALATDNVHVLGGRRHFDLLADRDVIDQIIGWIGSGDG